MDQHLHLSGKIIFKNVGLVSDRFSMFTIFHSFFRWILLEHKGGEIKRSESFITVDQGCDFHMFSQVVGLSRRNHSYLLLLLVDVSQQSQDFCIFK